MRAPAFLICIFLAGCAFTGSPTPETPREKYAAAESSYTAAVLSIDQFVTSGQIVKGSPTAQSLASSLRAARQSLNLWGAAPDNLTNQQAALTSLTALQALLTEVQRRVQ